jgi:lipoyl(octanoyl) transferase
MKQSAKPSTPYMAWQSMPEVSSAELDPAWGAGPRPAAASQAASSATVDPTGRAGSPPQATGLPPTCQLRDLGRIHYLRAFALQQSLAEQRKRAEIPDQILIVEHPHVVTMGRNAHESNLLASPELLERSGIELHHTDRGGDVTYHGPGQIVVYPIFDLREWKRDVGAYVRAIEQVIIDTLADFGISGDRLKGATGVWVGDAKIAAIGVHISRWVTSHGFALNVTTDLNYFRYIVPCGLTKPVTSFQALGIEAHRNQVVASIVRAFERNFDIAVTTENS